MLLAALCKTLIQKELIQPWDLARAIEQKMPTYGWRSIFGPNGAFDFCQGRSEFHLGFVNISRNIVALAAARVCDRVFRYSHSNIIWAHVYKTSATRLQTQARPTHRDRPYHTRNPGSTSTDLEKISYGNKTPPVASSGLQWPPVGLPWLPVPYRGLSWSPVASRGLPWPLVVSSAL